MAFWKSSFCGQSAELELHSLAGGFILYFPAREGQRPPPARFGKVILKTLMRPVNDFSGPSESAAGPAPFFFSVMNLVKSSAILTRERRSVKRTKLDQSWSMNASCSRETVWKKSTF